MPLRDSLFSLVKMSQALLFGINDNSYVYMNKISFRDCRDKVTFISRRILTNDRSHSYQLNMLLIIGLISEYTGALLIWLSFNIYQEPCVLLQRYNHKIYTNINVYTEQMDKSNGCELCIRCCVSILSICFT